MVINLFADLPVRIGVDLISNAIAYFSIPDLTVKVATKFLDHNSNNCLRLGGYVTFKVFARRNFK